VRTRTVLYIHDLETGQERPVYDKLNKDQQEAWAIFGVYPNMAWLPGSKELIFWSGGTILTLLMCQAMNRSIWNVILAGRFKAGSGAATAEGLVMKEITKPDAAILLQYSKSVMIIPGYGLAVSQAQKTVKELDDLLAGMDVNVQYAI